ncbi:MAG: hypothetical protein ABIP17_12800 [Ilumatobacteraceae bacterium]
MASRHGAHVTPQAGVTAFGRYWTTTSRESLKRRAITASPVASVAATATTRFGETVTLTAGRARVLDPLDPATAVSDPFGASVIGVVAARIALAHLDDVVGYGQIAKDIPQNWSLRGRVLLSVEPDQRLVADVNGIVDATGRWATERELPPSRRRARTAPARLDGQVHAEVRRLVEDAWSAHGLQPSCSIGLSTPVGPVAMPAIWDPDHGSAIVRRDLLARLSPIVDAGACITLDRHADRRADEKVGLILRGRPLLRRLPRSHPFADGHVGVVIGVERVTWWHGFTAGTTVLDGRAAA